MRKLYCLYDAVSQQIVGGIKLGTIPGPMIREFHDVLSNREGPFYSHAQDYQLVCLGRVEEEVTPLIEDTFFEVVATGAAWKEAQNA